jgi:hypothetical protein
MLLHRHDLPVRHRDDDVRSPARLRSLLTQLEDSPIATPWHQARRSSNAKIVRQVPETFERRTRLGWALSTRSVPPPEPARRLTTPHHFVGDQLDERLHLSVGERVHCGFQGINAGVIHEVKRRRAGAGRQAPASASDRGARRRNRGRTHGRRRAPTHNWRYKNGDRQQQGRSGAGQCSFARSRLLSWAPRLRLAPGMGLGRRLYINLDR